MDEKHLREFGIIFCGTDAYKREVDKWKVPLLRKKIKRERKLSNPPEIQPPEISGLGLISIHFPDQGIQWPPNPEKVFAVFRTKGV